MRALSVRFGASRGECKPDAKDSRRRLRWVAWTSRRHESFAFRGMHSPHDAPSLFTLVHFARFHRKHPTRSEALLWAALRRRQPGPRFRRQHPFAVAFIVDFYCPSHRLVVEVDG